MYNNQDITNLINQDYILENITAEEQIDLISDQIKHPFSSGSINYFKKLKQLITDQDELDNVCVELLNQVQDVYTDLEFDYSTMGETYRIAPLFNTVYKFFIKNIDKLMFLFLKEYIFSNKNRKNLISEFSNLKLSTYPKEQYGKKENYILIAKLPAIIRSIYDNEVSLLKFIKYVNRNEESPIYIDHISKYISDGIIIDRGVVNNFFEYFMKSDNYNQILNKLEMAITSSIIIPYMKDNGLMDAHSINVIESFDEDINDDQEDDQEETY